MENLTTVQNTQVGEPAQQHSFYVRQHRLNDLWTSFKRHRLLAFVTAALVMIVFVAVVTIIPPHYRAIASVMFQARTSEIVKVDPVLSNLPGDSDTVASELQVLQARDQIARLVDTLHLDSNPEFDPNAPRLWQRTILSATALVAPWLPASIVGSVNAMTEYPPMEGGRKMNAVIDEVTRHFEIAPVGRSRVISISFWSKSQDVPAKVANTLAELYLGNQFDMKRHASEEANRWITENLAELRQRATAAAERVAEYRAANGMMDGKDSTLLGQQLSEISTQLTAAHGQSLALAAKVDNITGQKDANSNSQVLGSPIIQQLRQQQATLTTANASLNYTFGNNNPHLQANKAEIANIDRRIVAETQKIVASVRSDYQAAVDHEKALQQQFDAVKQQMARYDAASVHLKELRQEEQANATLYDNFLQRSKETGDGQTFHASEAVLISHAATPNIAYFPDKKVLLSVGGVASLMTALLMILGFEAADRGFRSQGQIERTLNIPMVGIIPEFRRDERHLEGLPDPLSMMGSAMTDIFMRICLYSAPKCVVIASALPREGKTLTGLFLARAAALNGKKVLLIDGDLRRSGLAKKLRLTGPGLSDVLTGTAAVEDVVLHDSTCRIDIIGCGKAVSNPAGLLISDKMHDLVKQSLTNYDLVFIDTPAVMAGPDATVLSRLANETLMFVRWAKTPRQVATAALRRIVEGGGTLSGIIMTRIDLKRIARYSITDAYSYSKAMRRYYPAVR